MQNGYHHTPNKGARHCDGDHGAKEKEEGGSGHHNNNSKNYNNKNHNNNKRWIWASQAKKIGSRIFTRDLHQGGRRAGQVGFLSENGLCIFVFCISNCIFVLSGGTGRRCQGGRSPPASTWGSRSPSTPGSMRSSAPASSPLGSRACCTCPSPSRRWSNMGLR